MKEHYYFLKLYYIMKASDLELLELVDFKGGFLGMHGRRLVIHDIHAVALFRKELIEKSGYETARKILTRFGYFAGQADAAAMKRLFRWADFEELIKAGARLQTLQGLGQVHFSHLECDVAKKIFNAELRWEDSAEAEEHHFLMGTADVPACWIMTGYMSGYVSLCMDKGVYFIETQCRAQNAEVCLANGKDIDSWGDEISPYLDFFTGSDIMGKVRELSAELKQQEKILIRQQRKLDAINPKIFSEYVEIRSESFRRVFELAARVAQFDTAVLINGESGTGKEVLARFIHRNSHRSRKPFVAINCGALPETLLEGELFGYKAGAFTGASKDRKGLFEEADGGVLLLDEIGDISPAMQLKLLRVLQEKEIRRLGENVSRKIDVKIIAATNRNLQEKIAEGSFREDLYFRLAVVEIEIPPLRERTEDIVPLLRHFIRQLKEKLKIPDLHIDSACIDFLTAYPWPGNIRELENTVERAAIFSKNGLITVDCLPRKIISYRSGPASPVHPDATLAEIEKHYILAALEKHEGNKLKTARALGISPVTLWRKLKQINENDIENS